MSESTYQETLNKDLTSKIFRNLESLKTEVRSFIRKSHYNQRPTNNNSTPESTSYQSIVSREETNSPMTKGQFLPLLKAREYLLCKYLNKVYTSGQENEEDKTIIGKIQHRRTKQKQSHYNPFISSPAKIITKEFINKSLETIFKSPNTYKMEEVDISETKLITEPMKNTEIEAIRNHSPLSKKEKNIKMISSKRYSQMSPTESIPTSSLENFENSLPKTNQLFPEPIKNTLSKENYFKVFRHSLEANIYNNEEEANKYKQLSKYQSFSPSIPYEDNTETSIQTNDIPKKTQPQTEHRQKKQRESLKQEFEEHPKLKLLRTKHNHTSLNPAYYSPWEETTKDCTS